jgi:hypothetical protein
VVKAVVSAGLAPQLPAALRVQPRLTAPVERSTHSNTVEPAEISPLRKAKRNIPVVSKATGQKDTICAIFPRGVQDNFISLEVVDRLGLSSHLHPTAVSSITWDSKRFSSTGSFVDLLIPMPGSDKSVARRFHIVRDCPFDMLLGTLAPKPSIC